ncbi:hypothetical protein BST61_g8160 [Cercospora zeina]
MPAVDPDDAHATAGDAAAEKPRRVTKFARQQAEKQIQALTEQLTVCSWMVDVDHPIFNRHLAPDFKFHLSNCRPLTSIQEYKEHLAGVKAAFPNWKTLVLECNVELQDKMSKAKGWVLMKHLGYPEGCEREALNIFTWKRDEEDVWVCQGHFGFPGVAPLPLPLTGSCEPK